MKKNLFFIGFVLFTNSLFSQIGINTESPKATLDVVSRPSATIPAGLIAPRITGNDLKAADLNYGIDQNGTIVYVTEAVNVSSSKTNNVIKAGYYSYNADEEKWEPLGSSSEPWFSKTTNNGAASNTENIYQQGQIGIGSSSIDNNAQLDVVSSSKGVLFPRLTTDQRDAIPASLANGLFIYNVSTNCFNYYDGRVTRWLSLCGDLGPATFTIFNCDAPSGPNSAYTFRQGTSLNGNSQATYNVVLNVSEPGNYTIKLSTTNGYSFYKTGVFNSTGQYTVALEGSGTPINHNEGAIPDDAVSLELNGIPVTPSCTLPPINVLSSGATITGINCTSGITYGSGTYTTGQNSFPTSTNYIDVAVTISGSGNITLETDTQNGLKFSSGSIAVTSATTSIRMFAQGSIGSTPGVVNFTLQNVTPNCSGNISRTIISSKGSFADPANRCTEILSINPSAPDGYYWVRDASSNKYKTYCDMSNGGWTLVKSLSEKQVLVVERTQNESIGSQGARNVVTTQTGIFNEYAFSVPSAVVNNIGNSTGTTKNFRFTIKEKGHQNTGTLTPSIVESTTTAPINDSWTLNNYWNVTINDGNPATGNYNNNNNTSDGKLFGFPWGKPVASSNVYKFNSIDFRNNPPGIYSQAGFFTGFYGGRGYVSTNDVANNLTYTSSNGSSATFNKYDINDLFGIYMNSENQINHHIGTCANSTDDYGGASSCNTGWANWRPHGFNNGEGRIVQYWVK
ncbi:fibrinogen-like YCDxxxxGGGW domain-containing protein [Chryseobacterium sp. SIMBA_029]|uniref:fibrinogen-like YCDxxxxGGGW domain-containing protein n=1 Tax=Chryseobacterium sp. SIMBA_029 TaxID=3085772 RepID=UPI00397ADA72